MSDEPAAKAKRVSLPAISPGSSAPASPASTPAPRSSPRDYFSLRRGAKTAQPRSPPAKSPPAKSPPAKSPPVKTSPSTSGTSSSTEDNDEAGGDNSGSSNSNNNSNSDSKSNSNSNSSGSGETPLEHGHGPDQRRRLSIFASSVTYRPPREHLPQGRMKRRHRSPDCVRFQPHVAFSNLGVPLTKNNTTGITLQTTQKGYRKNRRSRTFMVGVDENAYSDFALRYLLDELMDDGDEIVAVHVVDVKFDAKSADAEAQRQRLRAEAEKLMKHLQKRCKERAVKILLEYVLGKLHATFHEMIKMYSPAMLVVGTRGRSLGGIQSLVTSRNSFSKYCLQYSAVPVVVCRAPEKRLKKKSKRQLDAGRHTYAAALAMCQVDSGSDEIKHEADLERDEALELEIALPPDQEAHKVAAALGLPARFDPTIKPLAESKWRPRHASSPAILDVAPLSPDHVSPSFLIGQIREEAEEEDVDEPITPTTPTTPSTPPATVPSAAVAKSSRLEVPSDASPAGRAARTAALPTRAGAMADKQALAVEEERRRQMLARRASVAVTRVPPSVQARVTPDSDESDEEVEAKPMTGSQIMASRKKEKLHRMEQGEAVALKRHKDVEGVDEEEDESEGAGPSSG